MTGKYRWIDAEALDAFCLTIAVGAQLTAVESAFKIVPESRKLTTVAQYWDTFGKDSEGGNDAVQINTLGRSIIAFENNGWTGSDDYGQKLYIKIGCPVYVSIFKNINSVMRFLYASNGALVRAFDPLLYEPEGAIPEEGAFMWGLDHPLRSSFALAEKLTGIEITRDWLLGQAHPTYRTLHGNT